jgi:gluconate 5-dehydrogenase
MASSLFSLEGRVALITGAARGIGFAVASAMADAGAKVVLTDILSDEVHASAKALQAKGYTAEGVTLDVTDSAAVRKAVNDAIVSYGRLDIIVGNAGINARRASLEEWTEAEWDRVTGTNVKSCFMLAQAAVKQMKKQNSGRMIFTSSIMSLLGRSNIHGYIAAKAGLSGLTRSLACELAEFGINVNAVAPGYIATDMTAKSRENKEFEEKLASRIALKRWGRPEELAGAFVFLASEASSYVTGQTMFVDGGVSTTFSY